MNVKEKKKKSTLEYIAQNCILNKTSGGNYCQERDLCNLLTKNIEYAGITTPSGGQNEDGKA